MLRRSLSNLRGGQKIFWKKHLDHYDDFYRQIAPAPWYGSTFISRPYIDFLDKTKAGVAV